MSQENEGTLCAITEQGDLGLGIHRASDEEERESLRRRIKEMENEISNRQKNAHER